MPTRQKKQSEDGYTLIAVIFLLFLLALSLTVAAPRVAREIQRDRERETVHRGLQYRRAIQLYYRKFQAYPPTLDALVKTSNIRFLRQKYPDPITGKVDWKAIPAGQAKVPTLGFFGEPLAGSASTVAGTGPSGGNSTTSTSNATDSSSSAFGSTSTSSTSSIASSSSSSSSDGKTFGGAGIIGFEPVSTRQSILIYKKKDHYNEWEFTYDPLSDQKKISSNTGSIGTSAASTSTPIGSSSTSSSSSSNSSTQ